MAAMPLTQDVFYPLFPRILPLFAVQKAILYAHILYIHALACILGKYMHVQNTLYFVSKRYCMHTRSLWISINSLTHTHTHTHTHIFTLSLTDLYKGDVTDVQDGREHSKHPVWGE